MREFRLTQLEAAVARLDNIDTIEHRVQVLLEWTRYLESCGEDFESIPVVHQRFKEVITLVASDPTVRDLYDELLSRREPMQQYPKLTETTDLYRYTLTQEHVDLVGELYEVIDLYDTDPNDDTADAVFDVYYDLQASIRDVDRLERSKEFLAQLNRMMHVLTLYRLSAYEEKGQAHGPV